VSFVIRYEDDCLAVVAKEAGIVVHPAAFVQEDASPGGLGRRKTLTDSLSQVMPLAAGSSKERPGVVHRLDKDTSGLLVFAKTEAAFVHLSKMMKQRQIKRGYLALAKGQFMLPTGRIEAPVGRSAKDPTRMDVTGGRPAATNFRVLEEFSGVSLLELQLETGRTHQIRVHLSHVGHPVVGDPVYGRVTSKIALGLGLKRIFLHAASLHFRHPLEDKTIDVTEPLPEDLQGALLKARAHSRTSVD